MGKLTGAGDIQGVVFDMDGVILDSEQVWDEIREQLAHERGGRWHAQAHADMMGMSSVEWSRYMHEEIGVSDEPAAINAEVVRRILDRYGSSPPLLPGARDAVATVARRWPLALASSSNRALINAALEQGGLTALFTATVSSEEVERGKPAPDVYLEACLQLGVDPSRAAAIEDSHNGIRSAKAAGLRVIAIPNEHYPPDTAALAEADIILKRIADLTPEAIDPS